MKRDKPRKTLIELMRRRCERDIELFALKFFPQHVRRPFGRIHRQLFAQYRRGLNGGLLDDRVGRRLAIAAPRGAAKSTLMSLIFPIHATLYGRERYIIILSATLKQARQRLRNIKAEFDANPSLLEFYAEELGQRGSWTQKGLTLNNVQSDIFSAGTEIRGISFGSWRPTLVILDDIEDSRAVRSVDRREELLDWYNEVIENIGDSYTTIEIVGTLLHPDSLLASLLGRADYESQIYKSIEQFACREDLWDQWKLIFTNLSDEEREQSARVFFQKHRSEMMRGTRVLWNAREDYYDLMRQTVTLGRKAFFKEKQNEPTVGLDAFFDIGKVVQFQWTDAGLEVLPGKGSKLLSGVLADGKDKQRISSGLVSVALDELRVFGFLDSATGRGASRKVGDYAAIATVGVDGRGMMYLLDMWLRRVAPTAQISAIFDLHQKWNYAQFGVETNCFQELLLMPIEQERQRRREAGELWQLAIVEKHHSRNKQMRIASLEPLISNGWLCFGPGLPDLFWAELESFPQGRHDDGIDALEAAIDLMRGSGGLAKRGARRRSISRISDF